MTGMSRSRKIEMELATFKARYSWNGLGRACWMMAVSHPLRRGQSIALAEFWFNFEGFSCVLVRLCLVDVRFRRL